MTLRTITFNDEQWQVVPRELPGNMIDTINGHIDADSDAVALWRDALIDAPEPPAQQPTRDLLAEATEQVEALDRENHQMRRCVARLMARLTVWLDDDQFNEADGIMYPEFEPPAQQPMTPAAIDVLAERRRQVEAEGWTPEHDDAYDSGSLAKAAACYALSSVGVRGDDDAQLRFWPWLDTWWKPSTPRRDLVKAGALILAEIERLDRVGKGESDD